MSTMDLFPGTIPANYADDNDARELAWLLVKDWFGALSYQHNESTHAEILDSLDWPDMPGFVADASAAVMGARIDYALFADGIYAAARAARAAGLVVPDGKPRQRKRAADMVGDLFAALGVQPEVAA